MTKLKPENIDHEHPSAASTNYHPNLITEADRQGLTTGMAVRETLKEEPTIQEIADACRGTLDNETCDEIVALENADEALGLAFTSLIENGIEDPEAFLRAKGILE